MQVRVTHTGRALLIALPKVPERVATYLEANLFRGVLETQRAMQDGAPKSSSLLTNAIQANKIDRFTWELVAATNYATAVEEGSDPGGLAPVQAVYDWIKQKRITPDNPDLDQMDLAFIIQRTIQSRGIKAQPYMQPALIKKTTRLNNLISQAISDGLHNKG